MGENTKHDFGSIKHQTLADLVKNPIKIEIGASNAGHTDNLKEPVVAKPVEEKKPEPKKKETPATVTNGHGYRGRRFIFKPTSEPVTVVREKVGNAYDGDWIHEVVSGEGKLFLASMKQLVDLYNR